MSEADLLTTPTTTALEVLEFPDPRLRITAKRVKLVNDAIRQLTQNMLYTMYAAKGIGLAATQINVHKRIIVMDVSGDHDAPQVLINPSYKVLDDTAVPSDEGCLSVPGVYESVPRAERIQVDCLNEQGEPQVFEAQGLEGACIQHECDHLDGKLFVDYLSSLKRQRIRKKLEKQHKLRA